MRSRIDKFVVALFVVLSTLAFSERVIHGEDKAHVTGLGFKYADGDSKFEITFDKPVQFEKTVSETDKQVIIDVANAQIAKKFSRALDTSSYKSNVSIINPYQSGERVRVTLQLLENGRVDVSEDGKSVVVSIDNMQVAGSASTAATELPASTTNDSTVSAPVSTTPPTYSATNGSADSKSLTMTGSAVDKTAEIESFFDAQKNQKYVGKPISFQAQNLELAEVFQLISEWSEFNIVLSDNVKGKVMLNLNNVPWDQALDLVLKSYRLAAERHGNVLRVTTMDSLLAEKAAESAAMKANEQAEPLVVKIFPVSYADPASLRTILTDFLSRDAQAIGSSVRGTIQIDSRTNSLIIRDTASAIEKIKRILKELDSQTPQILIESKFVAVSETNAKDVHGRIFATTRELQNGTYTANNSNNNFSSTFGGAQVDVPASGFAVTIPSASNGTGGGAGFGFMPKYNLIPGLGEIGAFINILESDSHAKTIASPRVVTQNKQAASISQGLNVSIPIPGGANSAGSIQQISVALALTVTPQVTNDGSVVMKVNFSQTELADRPPGAQFATSNRSVDTSVLVDSGATLVIGGIYQSSDQDGSSGIPVLRELPIIGPFFGSKTKLKTKNELFIFVTPRILNDKEAGMKG